MSDEIIAADEQAKKSPPSPTFAESLQFVRENFVLVSAAAALVGITLSTTFLAAYLSVFDWHLLWFVQYPDIITFGLLAVSIIGGSLTFIQSAAQMVLGVFDVKGRSKRGYGIFLAVFVLSIVALQIWNATLNGEGYFHVLMGAAVLGLGIITIWQAMRYITGATMPNLKQGFFLCLLVAFTTVSLGQWLGYSVRESSKALDIVLKDKTLTDMRVIIVMSRHTVLFKGDDLFVVPTADITQFQVKGGMLQIPVPPEYKGTATVPPAPDKAK